MWMPQLIRAAAGIPTAGRAWGGARKKVALSAKVGDAVCIRGPWGMGPGCL